MRVIASISVIIALCCVMFLPMSYAQGSEGFYPYGAWNPTPGFPSTPPYGPPGPPINPEPVLPGPRFMSLLAGRIVPEMAVGIYYGTGTILVDQDIEAGATQSWGFGIPDFDAFSHKRKTDLSDAYLSLKLGLRSRGVQFFVLNADTNLQFINRFKQLTEADVAASGFGFRTFAQLLDLSDNSEGEIRRNNRNNGWTVDASLIFPVLRRLDFLLGYRYFRMRSKLDPYSATIPASTFGQLPGLRGWENVWAGVAEPSETAFDMSQVLEVHGPLVGARLGTTTRFPRSSEWHLEALCVPYLWGKYEFNWRPEYNLGPGFITGSSSTKAHGLYRFWVEGRGDARIQLTGPLHLDFYAKYSYLYLEGTTSERQLLGTNGEFLGGVPPETYYSQGVGQIIKLTQHFWGVGGGLSLIF